MQWKWDDRKAARNLREHGVRFETAVLVFEYEHCVSGPDPHEVDDRWRTIGLVGMSTLFVVHTQFEEDCSARIISARKATPVERRLYERLRF
jgi:uncharacterized protein